MKIFNTHVNCSECGRSLTLWNINTCTQCGHKLCGHHVHLLKNPHSYVLSSVCYHCADHAPFIPVGLLSHTKKHATSA
jgi:predicted amidophosphoribosyltransferase